MTKTVKEGESENGNDCIWDIPRELESSLSDMRVLMS